MSHGTPSSLEDVERFYTEILRGRPPSTAELDDLERRYRSIGGVSPLAERTEAQVEGMKRALEASCPGRFVVASGTKYSEPRIEDAVEGLVRAGVVRATAIVLAPHSSVVSVGEYARRALDAARGHGESQLDMDVVDSWYLAPGLVDLLSERVDEALSRVNADGADAQHVTEVLFTAHSIPAHVVDGGDTYPEQVTLSARAVADACGLERWRVAWQSAGRSAEPWLGPDVSDVIEQLPSEGVKAVVVCPIGFVSDHLEVLYDLDVEAASHAREAGLRFARTQSLNDDPRFCEVLAQVVLARNPGV